MRRLLWSLMNGLFGPLCQEEGRRCWRPAHTWTHQAGLLPFGRCELHQALKDNRVLRGLLEERVQSALRTPRPLLRSVEHDR